MESSRNRKRELRALIEWIDTTLIQILAKKVNLPKEDYDGGPDQAIDGLQVWRIQLALQIEEVKRQAKEPVRDEAREQAELARLLRYNKLMGLGLTPEKIEAFFLPLFAHSVECQKHQRTEEGTGFEEA